MKKTLGILTAVVAGSLAGGVALGSSAYALWGTGDDMGTMPTFTITSPAPESITNTGETGTVSNTYNGNNVTAKLEKPILGKQIQKDGIAKWDITSKETFTVTDLKAKVLEGSENGNLWEQNAKFGFFPKPCAEIGEDEINSVSVAANASLGQTVQTGCLVAKMPDTEQARGRFSIDSQDEATSKTTKLYTNVEPFSGTTPPMGTTYENKITVTAIADVNNQTLTSSLDYKAPILRYSNPEGAILQIDGSKPAVDITEAYCNKPHS